MITLRISDTFAKFANQLPKEAKIKLLKIFMLLTQNPHYPSLQLKKVKGSSMDNIYECRVDDFWRLILQMNKESNLDLIYVGPHDDAIYYGYGLLHKLYKLISDFGHNSYSPVKDTQERWIEQYISESNWSLITLDSLKTLLGLDDISLDIIS